MLLLLLLLYRQTDRHLFNNYKCTLDLLVVLDRWRAREVVIGIFRVRELVNTVVPATP